MKAETVIGLIVLVVVGLVIGIFFSIYSPDKSPFNRASSRVESRGAKKGLHIEYETARKAVKQIAKCAGIERWNEAQLYTSRRGRNTELSQILSYSQHCKQAGWQQDSDMPRIYNQTAGIDITGALLSPYGIMIDHMKNEKQAWIEILKLGQDISGNNLTTELVMNFVHRRP